MKKVFLLLSIMVAVLLSFAFSAYAQTSTSVYCDDTLLTFDEGPYIIDGATFVPVKDLSESFDFNYSWDSANRTVVISSSLLSAWVQADNSIITVNKDGVLYTQKISAAPCIINSRIYVPLRAIAELFDGEVSWDSSSNSVIITFNNEDTPLADDAQNNDFYITDFEPPQVVTLGSSYILSGTVGSVGTLDRLNIKIIDTHTDAVEINETAFDINTPSYSLADIDSRITFGKLTAGSKLFQITCVDKNEQRNVFSYEFVISNPQGAEVTNPIPMLWPVPSSGIITTIFWCDNSSCHSNAGRASGHAAIDISADEGAPVIAVADGVVELQGFGSYENAKTGYGNFILLDHGDGLQTQYSHLFEIYVTDGQQVSAGDVIGAVGNTGNSTGNHLDFYISQDGVRCDPLYYLDLPAYVWCWEECDGKFFDAALEARGIIRK